MSKSISVAPKNVTREWLRTTPANERDGFLPAGYTFEETYFVDASGFGQPGEGALTIDEFIKVVKPGYGYVITGIGQFQVYISEFKKGGKLKP